jgi:PAS domain S-box-containing protein
MSPSAAERIVVIDDNPAARYSTSRILRSTGREVLEAGTGTEGLDLVDEQTALVVLDINLPDIDGFEVCRRLRSAPGISDVPIVHLSATFVEESDKVKGLEGGADGYLTHPVEPLVLIATVNTLLRARKAEEERRTSDARFRVMFEKVPTGIALLDEQARYVQANPAMCTLLGLSEEELIGRAVEECLAESGKAAFAARTAELDRAGRWSAHIPAFRKDGSEVAVDWNLSTFSSELVLAIATDISDRLRADADRERLLQSERAARAEAERANRTKDDFLATLSHELRNPLHVIVNWAGVLTQLSKDPELRRGLEAIDRSADLLGHLIGDLLDVARISAGKLSLNTEQTDLVSIVSGAVAVVTPSAVARQVRIELDMPRQAISVTGDPARLQQVVWNLVSNAIKFTPSGGSVRVQTEVVGSAAVTTVTDTGRGIHADFIPHIFERFRQETSGKRSGGGLGLGLAIVKHLVEMHGGVVEAISEGEGKGSTFRFELPLSSQPGSRDYPAGARADAITACDLSSLRVLVIDDDAEVRAPVCRILADAGAEVAESGDVAEALERIESFQPGIVVSDIGMDGRDGYELIREVRRRGHTPEKLPALAITAFARPEDRLSVLSAGYQMHLPKPVNAQQLLTAVDELTKAARSASA